MEKQGDDNDHCDDQCEWPQRGKVLPLATLISLCFGLDHAAIVARVRGLLCRRGPWFDKPPRTAALTYQRPFRARLACR
jgi:hypothetical protein